MDTRKRDDFEFSESGISMSFLYTPNENITAFANIASSWLNIDDERHRRNSSIRSRLSQGYVLYKVWEGFKISIGRQRIKDRREWVYDEELDAIRLTYRFQNFAFDFSASEKKDKGLYDSLGSDERINNFVLFGRYAPFKNTEIMAYGFVRDGRSKKRKENPIFYGLQFTGEVLEGLDYWLSFGHVRGRSGSDKLRGFGFDSGFTYELDLPLKPSIVLGYAFGSGDDNPSDDVDRSYRQTGLQDNTAKFNGYTRIQYYGEMFDPELSNLAITTAGFGIKPLRKASIELIHHYYRQHKRSDEIRDAEINEDPDGLNKILGQEIDFVAAYKYRSKKMNIRSSIVLGYFMPGQAFPDDADNSFFAEIKVQFDF
jgi:alginate production protein